MTTVEHAERVDRSQENDVDQGEDLYVGLLTREGLQDACDEYLDLLDHFIEENGLDEILAGAKVDHVSVKVADNDDLVRHIDALRLDSEWVTTASLPRHRVATVKLNSPLDLDGFSETCLVELAVPRQGKDGDNTKINSIAIHPSCSLRQITSYFERKGVNFQASVAGIENIVSVRLNDGQQVRFTDSSLEEKTLRGVRTGRASWEKEPNEQVVDPYTT